MVILKSKLSGYYFKGFGAWGRNVESTMEFPDEWVARAFGHREQIEGVRGEPSYDSELLGGRPKYIQKDLAGAPAIRANE